VATELDRITELAKQDSRLKFTSLVHHINTGMLCLSHQLMPTGKAVGIDKVTREEYEQNLEANLNDLVNRMKRQAYKPQPARRVYIPKPGSDKMRPLGIPAYEDKLVQKAMAPILNAIHEADFLPFSFGFRPGRGCHDALKVLRYIIEEKPISYIVDVDIKGFFDNVDHEWMMKFLEHRIADANLLRLISRFLKAGIMEAGIKYDTHQGTPQGGVISPILANVYLHYVLDLWFEKRFKKSCKGKAYLVRYADDFVGCFQYEADANRFLEELKARLGQFKLEIAEDKTSIIQFGRFAEASNKRHGLGKPDTFNFLGFTHYCSKSAKGRFRVKRKTSRKKFNASLVRSKDWFRSRLTIPANELVRLVNSKLIGHYRYYGITDNAHPLANFRDKIQKQLYWWFCRRSQGKHYNWEKFSLFLAKHPLPNPKVYVNIYDIDPKLICYIK
jgi:RNA-directed DNA polymerase